MSIKKLYLTASMTMMGLAFTACSHDDFIDNNAPVNNQKAEYADNFVKKYGAINPNQTWDFCSMEPTYSLVSSNVNNVSATRTRAGEGSFTNDKGEIIVENDVLTWMHNNMPKGQNNKVKGEPFKMTVPGNAFTIAPIYQGCARFYWQLWMYVEGVGDILVWEKGNDFYYMATENSGWEKLGVGTDGLANGGFFAVKSPTYTFTNLPKDADMYFYLKVWKNGSFTLGYDAYLNNLQYQNQNTPVTYSSLEGRMISLTNAQKPKQVPNDYKVTIIGCEDDADSDYEDLVFMVYGKPVPPTERVEEVESACTKRYLMEDLGTTDDFDFNDVVVDVQTDRKKITYIYDNTTDELIDQIEESLPDQAIVRATGGTLDFTLTIGTTTWTKSEHKTITEMWNTGWGGTTIDRTAVLGEPFVVENFDAAQNNISVSVVGNDGFQGVKTITFPKKGEAPMIIAVDHTVDWMKERSSVPDTWFYIPEE
jgi:hypothetical protein